MGDLQGAPAVHFNLPLLSFYRYTTFKTGIAFGLWNRGCLVNVSDPCFETVDPSSLLFLTVLATSPGASLLYNNNTDSTGD